MPFCSLFVRAGASTAELWGLVALRFQCSLDSVQEARCYAERAVVCSDLREGAGDHRGAGRALHLARGVPPGARPLARGALPAPASHQAGAGGPPPALGPVTNTDTPHAISEYHCIPVRCQGAGEPGRPCVLQGIHFSVVVTEGRPDEKWAAYEPGKVVCCRAYTSAWW